MILEDDAQFLPHFEPNLETVFNSVKDNTDIDVLYLHYSSKVKFETNVFSIFKTDIAESKRISYGSTVAYIITKQGAKKMLDFIEKTGMTNAIDTMMQNACDNVNIYYPTINLIKSEMVTLTNNIDSDIQLDNTSLSEGHMKLINKEFTLFYEIDIKNYEITLFPIEKDNWFSYKLLDLYINIPLEEKHKIDKHRFVNRFYLNDKLTLDL